jgi:hypothetical protein
MWPQCWDLQGPRGLEQRDLRNLNLGELKKGPNGGVSPTPQKKTLELWGDLVGYFSELPFQPLDCPHLPPHNIQIEHAYAPYWRSQLESRRFTLGVSIFSDFGISEWTQTQTKYCGAVVNTCIVWVLNSDFGSYSAYPDSHIFIVFIISFMYQ